MYGVGFTLRVTTAQEMIIKRVVASSPRSRSSQSQKVFFENGRQNHSKNRMHEIKRAEKTTHKCHVKKEP